MGGQTTGKQWLLFTQRKKHHSRRVTIKDGINRAHSRCIIFGLSPPPQQHTHCGASDVLDYIALEQAVWILQLQRLLVLH